MELIKDIFKSKGYDWEGQFSQKRTKIRPKLKKLVRLPLGFWFGNFLFEAWFGVWVNKTSLKMFRKVSIRLILQEIARKMKDFRERELR